jgi:glycosyltransferase involved in cell wall biosynthesis
VGAAGSIGKQDVHYWGACAEGVAQGKPIGHIKRILIVHQNFPGQFLHLARSLARRSDVQIIGLGRETAPGMSDVTWYKYKLHRKLRDDAHPYLRQMEDAVLHGQAVARAMGALKGKGFVPDIILAHPGWGETLYAKEIFPAARLIHFCEWYYSTEGADFGFDPEFPPALDDRLRITTWNALHLLNLQNCDEAITPTQWQKDRHPEVYQDKLRVIHEGIDLANLAPDSDAAITLMVPSTAGENTPSGGPRHLVLRHGDPVITYVARNLEPYRGFHTFMRALPRVMTEHPRAQVLIVGGNGRSYGALPKDAANWREKMWGELQGELEPHKERIHFLGKIPYTLYKQMLQVSAVHVYLTYPFVLSWSLLESMAMGCQIVASDTAPVREVLRDGENAYLVDFFDSELIAQKLLGALNDTDRGGALRACARADAAFYAMETGLRAYESLLGLCDNGLSGLQSQNSHGNSSQATVLQEEA